VIYTDHKLLMGALHRSTDPWTARQCGQLYTGDIRHISGKNNVVADTLSRPPAAGSSPSVAAIAATAEAAPLLFPALYRSWQRRSGPARR
jgi:hypothetical protein